MGSFRLFMGGALQDHHNLMRAGLSLFFCCWPALVVGCTQSHQSVSPQLQLQYTSRCESPELARLQPTPVLRRKVPGIGFADAHGRFWKVTRMGSTIGLVRASEFEHLRAIVDGSPFRYQLT